MFSSKQIIALALIAVPASSGAAEWLQPEFRSRLQYSLAVDQESSPFPWNYTSRSAVS